MSNCRTSPYYIHLVKKTLFKIGKIIHSTLIIIMIHYLFNKTTIKIKTS